MIKRVILSIVLLIPLSQFAQDFSGLWEGHFSYNNIKEVVKGNNKIYAASGSAVFILDTQTNEMEELTTVNGLSGETISTIKYSEDYELLIIGYENGLLEVAFDNDEDILTIVDIVDKTTIAPTERKINHFNVLENIVYISTNYGISVFDLERLEFGDTYFIGNGGSQIQVNQTAIFDDYIYAACQDGGGIRKALASSSSLIDYQNWQVVTSGDFLAVEALDNKLYVLGTNRRIYEAVNDVLNELFLYSDAPIKIIAVNENLVVTTKNNVFVYNNNFNLISKAEVSSLFDTEFTSASIDSEYTYVGTKDFGILKTSLINPLDYQELHPQGPLLNTPFSIQASPDNLWVTYGDHDLFYNPYPLNNLGFSHLNSEGWINTTYNEALEAKCLNTITINPFNTSQVFISSFFSGLLELNEDTPLILHNETNSGLESLIVPGRPNYVDIRVGPSAFDNNGLLWTVTSLVDKPLKSFNPSNNEWESFDFTSVIPDINLGFGDIAIEDNGVIWIASYKYGLIGFNKNSGSPLLKSIKEEEQNIPSVYVTTLALDNRNQLWIGTFRGLRVLYNTSTFFDNDVSVEDIIIEEDGIAKELLFQQHITDIKVDGSNNKWIGTSDSGLFYFSSDGQETIFHFTKDNSPLPSNSITDVSLDSANGIVYIATSKGLVSFRSGGSSSLENLESAHVYPNPVRPKFNVVDEKVKIKDISENVNIKITDIEGNLVAEAQSNTNQRYGGYNLEIDGGTAYWNGKNMRNNVVASGVYLIMLSDLDSFETKVLKLMVVR
ncbi:two-component regulator propeller domain-containing protein [Flavivirga jejuensis]|uniref:Two-component regulator propeller domain-containing protein n=1 Tax=Flavivirga jejuensis TaxID=870487 RepID=A0ABT8WI40_9FLAO|nr:two-component regulator propeller domain-containing protein [Flavivirga jejuensis]MDO5972728.1 two-component regulator propeller domain-containing protein [Flavivirga jejuensis]